MSEMRRAMDVHEIAMMISGAPFPSMRSLRKAREIVERFERNRAPQWQPIESAPKDGARLMLWDSRAGGYAVTGAWVAGSADDHETITHWQPLPAPPEVVG